VHGQKLAVLTVYSARLLPLLLLLPLETATVYSALSHFPELPLLHPRLLPEGTGRALLRRRIHAYMVLLKKVFGGQLQPAPGAPP
jgi:hypothetical protein